jgi:hypothetical protein
MIDETKARQKRVNYYLTLDIVPGVSHNEILHAYNRAKNTYSGGSLASYTLMEDGDNSSITEEIEQAFLILGNPAKRRVYDIEMGFNTWNEDSTYKSEDRNAVDMLGAQRNQRVVTPETKASQPAPISSVAASIASIGDMEYRGETMTNVIPLSTQAKAAPAAVVNTARPNGSGNVGGVDFEPNPEFEKQIAAATEVTGAFLKAVRIYRRYTPESLALKCKLSTSHVLTMENEDTASMHQAVYLRGHIYLICQALDLPNPDRLAKHFVDRMNLVVKLPQKRF